MTVLLVLLMLAAVVTACGAISIHREGRRREAALRFHGVLAGHTPEAVARRKANTEAVGRTVLTLRVRP